MLSTYVFCVKLLFFSTEITSTVCAVGLMAAASAIILKNFGYKGVPVLTSVVIIVILSFSVSRLLPIFDISGKLPDELSEYVLAAVKAVGIGYLSGISSDICKELGEAGIAKGISVAAKIELILIAAPFVSEAASLAVELIGGSG